ncbi:hypothetical protein BhenCHDE101_01420 [Bartonella henselae]|nr:hypothetical protein BhenCHDE101_01420 [Bartonella henselae]PNM39348.1 hypothetical protein AL470_000680 [Bartonella henselae str. Houston-1]
MVYPIAQRNGKFLLSLNDALEIQKNLQSSYYTKFTISYTCCPSNNAFSSKELIIINCDL